MISFRHKGDFSKTQKFIQRALEVVKLGDLDRYGKEGVAALESATPVDTGKTAASWSYRITHSKNGAKIEWLNSNVVDGANIAVLLQYGHATNNGGWVEGYDYINPAIQPIFDRIAQDAFKEVSRV